MGLRCCRDCGGAGGRRASSPATAARLSAQVWAPSHAGPATWRRAASTSRVPSPAATACVFSPTDFGFRCPFDRLFHLPVPSIHRIQWTTRQTFFGGFNDFVRLRTFFVGFVVVSISTPQVRLAPSHQPPSWPPPYEVSRSGVSTQQSAAGPRGSKTNTQRSRRLSSYFWDSPTTKTAMGRRPPGAHSVRTCIDRCFSPARLAFQQCSRAAAVWANPDRHLFHPKSWTRASPWGRAVLKRHTPGSRRRHQTPAPLEVPWRYRRQGSRVAATWLDSRRFGVSRGCVRRIRDTPSASFTPPSIFRATERTPSHRSRPRVWVDAEMGAGGTPLPLPCSF